MAKIEKNQQADGRFGDQGWAPALTQAPGDGNLPYQSYVGSILHQYVNGELIETRTVEVLKKLKAS